MSPENAASLGIRTPYPQAPDLCVEIVSPSNSRKEIEAKIGAYLGSGAHEVWIVYPQTRRIEWFGSEGRRDRPLFAVDARGLFDSV